MGSWLAQFVRDEDGIEAIEYGMIASLIFLATIGAVNAVATEATSMWSVLSTHI
ncbi:MAG: Flp family type IVb pilin [Myxococcales bacterium]|nr:Flp family type IVb pilin [Myxococcales bacterium]